jgi:hypothetical protein
MSHEHDTPKARTVNTETPSPIPPRAIAGAIYFQADVIHNFGIDVKTFRRWKLSGLRTTAAGTRSDIVLGDDLNAFFRTEVQLAPAYSSPHKKKNAARRKKDGTK